MLDAREPTNCNDDDLEVNMMKEPTEREEFTDASFTLMLCELRRLCYYMLSSMPSLLSPDEKQQAVICELLRAIDNARSWAAEKFFKGLGARRDIRFFAEILFNMLLDKLIIIVRDTNIFEKAPYTGKRIIRDQSGFSALSYIENMRKLREDPPTRQWAWVLVNFRQWYAIGIVLIHLQAQTWDSACERAWNIAVKTINEIPPAMMTQNP